MTDKLVAKLYQIRLYPIHPYSGPTFTKENNPWTLYWFGKPNQLRDFGMFVESEHFEVERYEQLRLWADQSNFVYLK